ncbi:hypothetical protein V7S43_015186 [Phytophthora oleae]|uniref:Uncharacterized protein n=1 Tax=Phytophthora oleae TaxID=2107226 RepID=A0ABD3F458_9STRA
MDNSKRSMAGGNAEEKASQVGTAFTLCFWSINCDTFPFLSEDVAASLASIVESAWLPTALMAIDLEPRDRKSVMLASAMPRAERQEIALKGLTKVPGHEKMAAKNRAAAGKKRGNASTDRGEFKKIKRSQDN